MGKSVTRKRFRALDVIFHEDIMIKLRVGNLPSDTDDKELNALFSEFGRVFNYELTRDIFTGRCRGFGFVEMEGHHARAAIAGLDGKTLRGNSLRVSEDRPRGRGGRR
jgi:RNA recognition motif-containing protein